MTTIKPSVGFLEYNSIIEMGFQKNLCCLLIVLIPTLSANNCGEHCVDCDPSGTICFACQGDKEVNVFGQCHDNSIDKCIIYGPMDECLRCQPTYTLKDGHCAKTHDGCMN